MLDAIEQACRDVGWQVQAARVSIAGAEPRNSLLIQRGPIGLMAVDEGRSVRLCWLLQLTTDEMVQMRGLSVVGRRRLDRNLERICSDGRTTGSILEETRAGEAVIVAVMVEQQMVGVESTSSAGQRAVDGLVEISVIARRVASVLANIGEGEDGRRRRTGVLGTDPMVG